MRILEVAPPPKPVERTAAVELTATEVAILAAATGRIVSGPIPTFGLFNSLIDLANELGSTDRYEGMYDGLVFG